MCLDFSRFCQYIQEVFVHLLVFEVGVSNDQLLFSAD